MYVEFSWIQYLDKNFTENLFDLAEHIEHGDELNPWKVLLNTVKVASASHVVQIVLSAPLS